MPVTLVMLLGRGRARETDTIGDTWKAALENLVIAVDGRLAPSLAARGSIDMVSELFRHAVSELLHGEE